MALSLGVLVERVDNFMLGTREQHKKIQDDLNQKHTQNRTSIHDIKNDIQKVTDLIIETKLEVVTLKIKLAMYASMGGAAAGIITAVVTALIQKFVFRIK